MGKAAAEQAGRRSANLDRDRGEGLDADPLCPQQRAEQGRTSERRNGYFAHILAVLIVAIGALDCVSTNLALGTGHAQELNPLVRWMQEVCGAYWVWPKMAVHTALAAALLSSPTRAALVAMSAVSMMTLIAAINNLALYHSFSGLAA